MMPASGGLCKMKELFPRPANVIVHRHIIGWSAAASKIL